MVARHVSAVLLCLAAAVPVAAQPKGVDDAVKRGAAFLAKRHKDRIPDDHSNGIGPAAISGLALLEAGASPDAPALRTITDAVRDAAFTESKTYQIALCLLFLDRLGDRGDLPLIQVLAVRLLAGQNGSGGWGYQCLDRVPQADERRLRAGLMTNVLVSGKEMPKAEPGRAGVTGRLHPEVEAYAKGLLQNNARGDILDDNSNTQFGILGVWVARRNGVPVEDALDRIDRRFVRTQFGNGGWAYSGFVGRPGTPSMTCAGLLGMATGLARREENRLVAVGARKPDPVPPPKPAAAPPKAQGDAPFFNPPPPRPAKEPKPAPAQGDPATPQVRLALANLGAVLQLEARKRAQGGRAFDRGGSHGDGDLYFLWSLERVAVVYGLDTIGDVDWYGLGAEAIVGMQNHDGSWGRGRYGVDVDTSFALLFLTRANIARDLTSFVKPLSGGSEMRAAVGSAFNPAVPVAGPPEPPAPKMPAPTPKLPAAVRPAPVPVPSVPPAAGVPVLGESAPEALARELISAPAGGWSATLERVRDAKGADHTSAILLAIPKLPADRKKQARDALAARLTRMTAETLRTMLSGDDAELRRAAALACGTKDDKALVPDLIDRLTDGDDAVVRAARAGVKSLTGAKFDFGPEPGSTAAQRTTAAAAWRAWWDGQKK